MRALLVLERPPAAGVEVLGAGGRRVAVLEVERVQVSPAAVSRADDGSRHRRAKVYR